MFYDVCVQLKQQVQCHWHEFCLWGFFLFGHNLPQFTLIEDNDVLYCYYLPYSTYEYLQFVNFIVGYVCETHHCINIGLVDQQNMW